MLRFSGFELDRRRNELRDAGGGVVPLRRKSFDLLWLLASRAGEVLSREEVVAAIWPGVHVGQGSLYQCIFEIRQALHDDEHALLKVIQGRGYLFDTRVETVEQPAGAAGEGAYKFADAPQPAWRRLVTGRSAWVAAAGLACVAAIGFATMLSAPAAPPAVAIAGFVAAADPQSQNLVQALGEGLSDGLGGVPGLRLLAPARSVSEAAAVPRPDFIVGGSLKLDEAGWTVRAQLRHRTSEEVLWSTQIVLPSPDATPVRLTAAIGYPLATRLQAVLRQRQQDTAARVAVEQSVATIVRVSRERFEVAQTILERALIERPGDVDLKAALATHLVRGIQTNWYGPDDRSKAAARARQPLDEIAHAEPGHLAAQQASCRLSATLVRLAEALVDCAGALARNPWDGASLYQLGLAQMQLGRFEDALASFRRAEQGDQPAVSRWTWLLGIGWALLALDRPEESLDYFRRSIAQSSGSGRNHLLMAVALLRLGRIDEAREAVAAALVVRPGTTVQSAMMATRGTAPSYAAHTAQNAAALLQLGVPAGELVEPAELSEMQTTNTPLRR